jgi:hypothetical protein
VPKTGVVSEGALLSWSSSRRLLFGMHAPILHFPRKAFGDPFEGRATLHILDLHILSPFLIIYRSLDLFELNRDK